MARKKRMRCEQRRQEKGWSDCLASFECETQKSFEMRQTRLNGDSVAHRCPIPSL